MLTKVLHVLFAAVMILMFVICSIGHSGYEIGPPCHPGEHTCMTDRECEMEEAQFTLDNVVLLKGATS